MTTASGGVPATYLNSQQTEREKRAVFSVSLSPTFGCYCSFFLQLVTAAALAGDRVV